MRANSLQRSYISDREVKRVTEKIERQANTHTQEEGTIGNAEIECAVLQYCCVHVHKRKNDTGIGVKPRIGEESLVGCVVLRVGCL